MDYSLKDLRFMKVSKYAGLANGKREYFQLKNSLGTHYLIYEESPAHAPLAPLQVLRAKAPGAALCKVKLQCSTNAFCTGTCKNFYYELSNGPADPARREHSRCAIQELDCADSVAQGKAP